MCEFGIAMPMRQFASDRDGQVRLDTCEVRPTHWRQNAKSAH